VAAIDSEAWPALPYREWRETYATLHLWTQVIGKIRLRQTPWINHSWHVTLYVNARGLTTSLIPHRTQAFEIVFDFIRQVLEIAVTDGRAKSLPLRPQPVAAFYAEVMAALVELGVPVPINESPCEIAAAIPFSQDTTPAAYDAAQAHRFWRALVQAERVFTRFRAGFGGKCSPVHLFWGGLDLAVTRFSGRTAPLYANKIPGVALAVMQDAYSHEVSSAGFWPGSPDVDASFYSYAYPPPAGFSKVPVRPAAAYFDETLGEFLLPYEAVRGARDPDAELLEFLQSTYEAAAITARWDRPALERAPFRPASEAGSRNPDG
jgi:hypothetical protein